MKTFLYACLVTCLPLSAVANDYLPYVSPAMKMDHFNAVNQERSIPSYAPSYRARVPQATWYDQQSYTAQGRDYHSTHTQHMDVYAGPAHSAPAVGSVRVSPSSRSFYESHQPPALSAQHHAYVEHDPYTPNDATIKVIRPDATGSFPGDYAAIQRALGIGVFEAFPGNPSFVGQSGGYGASAPIPAYGPEAYTSKYTAQPPAGKYTPEGKYTAPVESKYTSSTMPFPPTVGMSPPAYEAHKVYRPDTMNCYVISKTAPNTHIGYRYVCDY